jgi:hypothetical protein
MFQILHQFRLKLIFVQGEIRIWFQSSTCGYPVIPTAFVEEAAFSPKYVFGSFVKKKLDVSSSVGLFLDLLFYSSGLTCLL